MNGKKLFVSERAAIQRVNRALAHEGKSMRVCRENSRWFNDLGRYYVVNQYDAIAVDQHANLEVWARDLGALKPYEEIKPLGVQ